MWVYRCWYNMFPMLETRGGKTYIIYTYRAWYLNTIYVYTCTYYKLYVQCINHDLTETVNFPFIVAKITILK